MRTVLVLLLLGFAACDSDRTVEPTEDAGVTDSAICSDGTYLLPTDAAVCLPDHECTTNDAGMTFCT